MLQYPVFFVAKHEDGRQEDFDLTIKAASVEDAMDQTYKIYLPRYKGEEGWQLVVVVDESRATDDEERAPGTTT